MSFCESMEFGISHGYFCFSTFKWEGLLMSPSPEFDVSFESSVRMKLAPPGWNTNVCVSNTQIYLSLLHNSAAPTYLYVGFPLPAIGVIIQDVKTLRSVPKSLCCRGIICQESLKEDPLLH